jgi:S1-C subfamily serine protease
LGVAIRCGGCDDSAPPNPALPFATYPEIAEVTPGSPASEVGLRRDDMLIAINGVSLRSREGAALFRSLVPDQRVTLSFVRDGAAKTVAIVPSERPDSAARARRRQI